MSRKMSLVLFIVFFAINSTAKSGPDSFADYVVPTTPELVIHSRFKVEIVQPYAGTGSREISYVFPRELTGDPGLLVKFNLVQMDETNHLSHWDSKDMTAICTDDGERVQCNIYVKKSAPLRKTTFSQLLEQQLSPFNDRVLPLNGKPLLDSTKAVEYLKNSGLSKKEMNDKLQVLEQFLSSEPGGILSYEYN